MKLTQLITRLEEYQYAGPIWIGEHGVSRRGNRKLKIQQFSYEPSSCEDYNEHESWFIVVVDSDENVLHWEQAV